MKDVKSHFSYKACSDFMNILTNMCPECDIATKISLGKTKCRYMILCGLSSYYKNELIKRINDSIYYSLSFDEALNSVIQKYQMDVNIRYWDSTSNLLDSINVSTAKLKEDSFLHLTMDGPNVNRDVQNKFDNKLVKDGFSKTLNIGSCAKHVFHRVFQTGSGNTG